MRVCVCVYEKNCVFVCVSVSCSLSLSLSLCPCSSKEGFSTVSPDIDERDPALRCADPQLLVRRIAEAKSDHLCQQQRDWLLAQGGEHSTGRVLLVTGDQVVVFQGQVREKPEGVQEARQFLSSYGGDCVSTVAAVCVTEVGTGLRRTDTDTVTLQFGDIPADCIDALVCVVDGLP